MAEAQDKALFERIKTTRDNTAYEQLFRRWYPSLVSYACHYVDMGDAENIVQDVMAYLWEKSVSLEIRESVSAYLHAAVRNRCLTMINRGAIRAKVMSAIRMSLVESSVDTDFYTVKELSRKLQSALAELPEEQRQAFELSRFDNKTLDQIAQETGVSSKTVEYRLYQAVKKLREALAEYHPLLTAILALPLLS